MASTKSRQGIVAPVIDPELLDENHPGPRGAETIRSLPPPETDDDPGSAGTASTETHPHRDDVWPIERIQTYDRNSREHPAEQVEALKRSIVRFGITRPFMVNETGLLAAGHGVLEAARQLGKREVPVRILVGLTDDEFRAYVIADNKLAERSEWNMAILKAEIVELAGADFSMDVLGFGDAELASLLAEDAPLRKDPDDAPPPPAVPFSRTGDVWTLGQHRVVCGDSTSKIDVAKVMADDQADCVWTDPPYNVAYEGTAGTIENDDMTALAFSTFLGKAMSRASESLRPGAPIYVAHADTEGLAFRKAFSDAGLKLAGCLIWRKNSLVLGRSDYQWQHEPILYGWKLGKRHTWYGGRNKTTVIDCDKPKRNESHPTMKPVALIQGMLDNSTKAGDIVLDLFGGSGSTLIACEMMGRRARLVELDPRFVDVIVERWQQATGRCAIDAHGRSFAEVCLERAQSDTENAE